MLGDRPRQGSEEVLLPAAVSDGSPARRYSKVGQPVGRGRFGEVYRGIAKATGEIVAIKVASRCHRTRLA